MKLTIPKLFYIDRKTTNIIKGVALVFMFIHHFFTFPNWLMDGIDYPWITTFATYFNGPFKICVSIFAFVTGYFYYSSKSKTLHNSVKKASDLWLIYILVFFIMLIPALCFGVYEKSVVKFVAEVLVLYTPTMKFCWYVSFYIIVMLLLPIISKFSEKNTVLMISLAVTVPFLLRYILLLVQGSPLVMLYDVVEKLSWMPCVLSGYVFAQYRLFDKLYTACASCNTVVFILIQFGFMSFPFFSRYHETTYDFLYAPMFIFGLVNMVNLLHCKWLFSPLCVIGKYSLPMWFLHAVFFNQCQPYVQWILYYPKNPVLVLIWGLVLCLLVSIVIMIPINFLVKIKNTIFFKH